jgi:hypothetical protein
MKEWFLCLIEIKGNFYINVGIRNKRIFVQPIFYLFMKKEDANVLNELKKEVGTGDIVIGKNASFIVRGLSNVIKFVERINEENFITSKKKDFRLWLEAISLIKDQKHLTKEGFLKICEIRDKMNLKKKKKNYKDKKFFKKLIEKENIKFENEERRKKISQSLRVTCALKSKTVNIT